MSAQGVKTLGSAIDLAGRGFYDSAFHKLDQCDLSETQHTEIKSILANLSLDTPPTVFSYGRQKIFCVFRNHSWFEYDPSVPFPFADLFTFAMEFLEVRDILSIAQVCKLWSDFSKDGRIWKRQSKIEGIPQVKSVKGKLRDPKADFIKLQPMTIGGKMISQYLGEFIGDIPDIDGKYVDALEEADFFEDGKLKRETFVFVVEPHFLKRINEKEPPTLRKDGDLITCPGQANKREIILPFSLTNLVILANNPLDGIENMPVVSSSSCPQVLRLCNARTEKVGVYFMRKECVKWSMGIPFFQKQWLGKQGFEMVFLRVRALFNFILILKTGTCPEVEGQTCSYVRTSDFIKTDHGYHHAAIGGFVPGQGICLTYYTTDQICVVPCKSLT